MQKLLFILPICALILASCGKQYSSEPQIDTSDAQITNSLTEDNVALPAPVAPMVPGSENGIGGKTVMEYISLEDAKAVALDYAQVTEAEFAKYDQDLSDGCYEFQFVSNGVYYEVDVTAGTGDVIKFKTDKDVGIPNFPEPITAPDLPSAPVLPT